MALIVAGSRSRTQVSIVAEGARGTTPGNPPYLIVPHLDSSVLNQTQTFERSNQVRSNRMGGKQVGGNVQAGGVIGTPAKRDDAVHALLESALGGTFTTVAKGTGDTSCAYSNSTITDSANRFLRLGFRAGMKITTAGSTTAGNNTTKTIVSVTAGVITVNSAYAANEAFITGTTITAAAQRLIAGTTRKFFTIEVAYLDLTAPEYEYFRGQEVNTLTAELPTSGEMSYAFDMLGMTGDMVTTRHTGYSFGSGSFANPATTVPYAGSVSGSALDRGGSTAPEVESLTININNNRAAKFAIGQQGASHIEEGDFDAELSFNLYFVDGDTYREYLAGTRTSLTVKAVDQQDGHFTIWEFPNIVFTASDKSLSGQTWVTGMTAFAEEAEAADIDGTNTSKVMVFIANNT